MAGLMALLGSGEYLPVMDDTDLFLLKQTSAVERPARVVCLPTAAGLEGDDTVNRWMKMGEEHFRNLGAEAVALPITNRVEADNLEYLKLIDQADLIYFSGGNPSHLYESMQGSSVWEKIMAAWQRGAVLAGCSAGAMFVGQYLPDFRGFRLRNKEVFGLLPGSHIFPHFDKMASYRGITLPILQKLLNQDEYALGLDEDTALVGRPGEQWEVMGRQQVYVITRDEVKAYHVGQKVTLPH